MASSSGKVIFAADFKRAEPGTSVTLKSEHPDLMCNMQIINHFLKKEFSGCIHRTNPACQNLPKMSVSVDFITSNMVG